MAKRKQHDDGVLVGPEVYRTTSHLRKAGIYLARAVQRHLENQDDTTRDALRMALAEFHLAEDAWSAATLADSGYEANQTISASNAAAAGRV